MCFRQIDLRRSLFIYFMFGLIVVSGGWWLDSRSLHAQDGVITAETTLQPTNVAPFEQTESRTVDTTTEEWTEIAPGIHWRSPFNNAKNHIVRIDLKTPGIRIQLAHQFSEGETNFFRRKSIFDFVSDEASSIPRPEPETGSFYPFVAINGGGFTCNQGKRGAQSPLNGILGLAHTAYNLVSEDPMRFGGRCNSFVTYQQQGDNSHVINLHRPNRNGHAPEEDFPYMSCANADTGLDYEPTSFGEIMDRDVADEHIAEQVQASDFTVGYGRTILVDGVYNPGDDGFWPRMGYKTAVGIGQDDSGENRYLFLATWDRSFILDNDIRDLARALAEAGARQAILLDGGGSSQFLSVSSDAMRYNGVRDEADCDKEPSGPRRILNSIVVYNTAATVKTWPAPRVAFVIDDTGSMGDEIALAQATVIDKVNQFVTYGRLYEYHLLTYKDDVTYRGATTDDRVLKARVSELYADGGDDCPENMLGALNEIADKAPNSNAWLMTDAGFHGTDVDVAATRYKLLRNRVIVHPIVYGWCSSVQAAGQTEQEAQAGAASTAAPMLGPEVLAQIAADTGGHYFPIASADTQAATSILLNEMVTESDLAASRAYVTADAPRTHSIAIDGTATVVNFLLNTYRGYAALTLFDAAGTAVDREAANVTYTELGNAIYYQIDDPAPGLWRAEITGEGEFAFSSSGDTEINFEYLGDAALAKGESEEIVASLTGPIAAAQFQLVTLDGTVVDTIHLVDDGLHGDGAARDGTYGGQYTPAREGDFRLQVQGVISESLAVASGMLEADESGPAATSFQRIALEVIHVHSLNVVGNETPVTDDGLAVTYVFSVTNNGTTDDTFDLIVSSDQGWADLTGVPTSLALAAGATAQIQITVHIPPTATLGSTNETTLIAVSRLNPLVSDADTVVTEAGIPTLTVAPNAVGLTEGQAQPGGSVMFEIVVENLGRVAMQNAMLHAIVPDHTSFNQDLSLAWPSALCSIPAAGGKCTKPLGTIAPGAQVTLRFAVNVDSALPPETRAIRLKTTLTMDNLALPPIAQETEVSLAFRLFLPLIDQ